MKFLGKWMELENISLSEVTQSQKNNTLLGELFTDGFLLPQKFGIYKIQFTDHMKPQKTKMWMLQWFLEE